MSVFEHSDFDAHQHIAFHNDPISGLSAIIAVHNTHLGPSLGGCRMFDYVDSSAALTDVLRLSKGMTYKAAMASLPMGGGKAVIIGDARKDKSLAMMQQMGRFVDTLNGDYIIAEDSGIAVSDVQEMARFTQHTGGISGNLQYNGQLADGNPAPATAYGVFVGLKTAVQHRLNRDLKGVKVAIAGIGHVGMRLAEHLFNAGAELYVADVYLPNLDIAKQRFSASVVSVDDISSIEVDVFAPCAMGNAINANTIEGLKAKVVAGAANNQLQVPKLGQELHERGILYAPDYVINAGGIIDIYHQKNNSVPKTIKAHLEKIGDTLFEVFQRCDDEGYAPSELADLIAQERFQPKST